MATRDTFSSASPPPVTGPDFADNLAAHIQRLYDASALPLTSVGGTGDAVTATLDPVLTAGLVEGMKFSITWANTNTGGMTLAINGGSPVAVLDSAGAAMVSGSAAGGTRALLEYVGGSFRVLGGAGGGLMMPRYVWQFTASVTWTKPSGLDDDTMVFVEAWGGGGGGGPSGAGGGGGGYTCGWFRLADLASSISVVIGAGGAVNTAGGNTTFGALLTAYGGGRSNAAGAGGGAGAVGAGGNNSVGTGGNGGRLGGGNGGNSGGNNGADASGLFGGGGGGAGTNGNGGAAIYGGGGGSGSGVGTGGLSLHGGSGGGPGVAGTAPAGGGGNNAAGARGEVRVWI